MSLILNFYCFCVKIGIVLNHENMEGVKVLHHNSRYDVISAICENHVKNYYSCLAADTHFLRLMKDEFLKSRFLL